MSSVTRWLPRTAAALGMVLASTVIVSPGAMADPLAKDQTPVATGKSVYELAWSASRQRLYVASAGKQGAVYIFNTQPLEQAGKIETPKRPLGVQIDDATGRLYTINTFDGSVSAIDLASGKVVDTLSLVSTPDHDAEKRPPTARDSVVDPLTHTLYVAGVGKEGRVWKVDGASMTLTDTIENTGAMTAGLAIDAPARRLYTMNVGGNDVSIIDLETDKVIGSIDVGSKPIDGVVDTEAGRLYVVNGGDDTISIIDTDSQKQAGTIATGKHPVSVNIDPEAHRLYVANRGDGTVQVFDTASQALIETMHTGLHPNTIAVDRDAHRAFVSNKGPGRHENEIDTSIVNTQGDTVTALTAPDNH